MSACSPPLLFPHTSLILPHPHLSLLSPFGVCLPQPPLLVSLSPLQQQEDSLEQVIQDTESLFKSREKEYQETIDQIEVRPGGLYPPPVPLMEAVLGGLGMGTTLLLM